MDLETYRTMHGWPEIPTDPDEVLVMATQGLIILDYDLLLYLWARSAGAS